MKNSFLTQIKSDLPDQAWSWVITSLRQDELIWETLIANEATLPTPPEATQFPERWNPAWVAFQTLGWPIPGPNSALSIGLRQRAFHTYEVITQRRKNENTEIPPLARSVLLTLALRERLRLKGKWGNLIEELSLTTFENWRTPLACLYGLIEKPIELLRALMTPGAPSSIHNLALHALLCNPLQPELQVDLLKSLIESLPIAEKQSLLRYLSSTRPFIATEVAQAIELPAQYDNFSSHLAALSDNYQRSEIAFIAGDTNAAKVAIDRTLDKTRLVQAQLFALQAQVSDTPLASWQKAFELAPEQPAYRSRLALELMDANNLTDARVILDPSQNQNHPDLFYATARLAHLSGEIDYARQMANEALQALENQFDTLCNIPESPPSLTSAISQFMLEINLPSAAIRAARLAIRERTDDPERLALLGKAQSAAGQSLQAAEAYQLAILLAPHHIDLHRSLAESLETAGNWASALDERKFIASSTTVLLDDQYALANCALHNDQTAYVLRICENILRQNPHDALAHTLIAEALISQHDWESAKEHFTLASEYSPELPRPWLSLAHAYSQNGEIEKALETLRFACQAIPTSAKLHLALGEQLLKVNSPTQALSALQRANEIDPRNIDIAIGYGQTLHQLGHLPQAHQVLQQAYQQDPSNPQVAHTYARILLGQDDPQTALAPLESVITTNPTDPEPYVDYAKALLLTSGDPVKATQALHSALSINPEHVEARAYLGEALAAQNDYPASLQAYQAILETPQAYSVECHARLSYGLGNVALRLGKIETAIAALLEAIQLDPQNYRPHCQLADAYQTIKLIPDSYQAAREALRLAGEDLPVMIWYAEKILALAENEQLTVNGTVQPGLQPDELRQQASQVLTRAAEVAVTQPNLLLRIANIQVKAGDTEGAIKNLHLIAKINTAQPAELQQAAQSLSSLSDANGAVLCLEKALEFEQGSNTNYEFRTSLLEQLAIAYRRANKLDDALNTIEKAISLAPKSTVLCYHKANILIELDQMQQALDFLEDTFNHLSDSRLYYLAALILRSQGKLLAALKYAETGTQIRFADDSDDTKRGQLLSGILAAELLQALLQPDQAKKILQEKASQFNEQDRSLTSLYMVSLAENALSDNREIEAVNFLGKALSDPGSRSPRLLALNARLTARRGDLPAGLNLFQSAIRLLEEFDPGSDKSVRINREVSTDHSSEAESIPLQSILYPLIEAALELNMWGIGLRLAQKSVQIAPAEPLAHLSLVKVLVQRAEFQNLCIAAEMVHHAPGQIALSEGTCQVFNQTIQYLTELCKNSVLEAGSAEPPSMLIHWQTRGEAIFSPSAKTARVLQEWAQQNENQEAIAASIAALRQTSCLFNPPNLLTEQKSGFILAQIALSLEEKQIQDAQKAIQLAILNEPRKDHHHAIRNFILARISEKLDNSIALAAIQTALAIIPDEPRWHALAATLCLEDGNEDRAINHLEQAIHLEPRHIEHHLALGNLYLRGIEVGAGITQSTFQAVKCFERACRVSPDSPHAWLSLAQAHRLADSPEQAIAAAETAATLAPDLPAPHLILAEIALQYGQLQKAYDHAQAVRRIQPDSQEAAVFLSRALQGMNRYAEALAVLDEVIPEAEQSLPLKLERIVLLLKSNDISTTLQAINDLSKSYPDDPEVLATLADIQAQAGQEDSAIRSAQKAILLGENLPIQLRTDLRLLLGRLLRQSGQLDQAIHHLDEALHLDPNRVDAYLELGSAHQERRQQAQALLMFRKAANLSPCDPRPYLMAGLALKEGKDFMESESMLRRAADLAPNDPYIRRQLAAVIAINLVHSPRRIAQTETL